MHILYTKDLKGLKELLQNMSNEKPDLKHIDTNIGKIAVYKNIVDGTIPIVFLHGVYYDHNLWNYQVDRLRCYTTISIDMPLHGFSKYISKNDWNLQDCADMILEVLDTMKYKEFIAVVHSWGSMTILRTAAKNNQKFKSLVLRNMSVTKGKLKSKLKFNLQHLLLPFLNFYTKQVTKAMFSQENR